VGAAGCVAIKRIKTVSRVVAAGCVAIKRLKTNGRVVAAGCEVEERVFALRGVLVRIASVRWWVYRLSRQRKRKQRESKRDEKTAYNPHCLSTRQLLFTR